MTINKRPPFLKAVIFINGRRGWFDSMFGPYMTGKALCECGALADLDEEVIERRKHLGKSIECIRCRNKRISKELDPEEENAEN